MVTGHNKVKGITDKAKGSTDSIVYIKSKRFSENYLPYLYYIANRINLLVRINVVKTTFTVYFSTKFGATRATPDADFLMLASRSLTDRTSVTTK